MIEATLEHWLPYFPDADPDRAIAIFARVNAAHLDRRRHYHNWGNVSAQLESQKIYLPDSPHEIGPVIFFQNLVLDFENGGDGHNEEDSISQAAGLMWRLGCTGWTVGQVSEAIRATIDHRPTNYLSRFICDLNLIPLSAWPDGYQATTARIRTEYAHMCDEAWAEWRREIIADFLGRKQIYLDAKVRDICEVPARRNLELELARLEAVAA